MTEGLILQPYDGIYSHQESFKILDHVNTPWTGSKGRSLNFQLRTWSPLESPAFLTAWSSFHLQSICFLTFRLVSYPSSVLISYDLIPAFIFPSLALGNPQVFTPGFSCPGLLQYSLSFISFGHRGPQPCTNHPHAQYPDHLRGFQFQEDFVISWKLQSSMLTLLKNNKKSQAPQILQDQQNVET